MNQKNFASFSYSKNRRNIGTDCSINQMTQQDLRPMDAIDNAMSISLNSNFLVDNGYSLVFDAVSDLRERSAPRWPMLHQRIAQPCHNLRDVVESSMNQRERLWNDRQIKKFDFETIKPENEQRIKTHRLKEPKHSRKKKNVDPIVALEDDFSCSMEEDNATHNLSISDSLEITFLDNNLYDFQEVFAKEQDLAPLIKKLSDRLESNQEYTCNYCGKLFRNSRALGGHVSKNHPNQSKATAHTPAFKRTKHSTN
jgi:hypothetical protein